MRILLDTHIFLWYISGDQRLSTTLKQSIRNLDNEVYLSVVSIWEAILKNRLGKLPLTQTPEIYLPAQRERHGISTLPLDEASVKNLAKLPNIHRDPFDHMLVCQALEYDLLLATEDAQIRAYPNLQFIQ